MLDTLRRRQPGAPLWRIAWWHLVHLVCWVVLGACYRYRVWGTHHLPDTGPVLLVSNHQSYLDPVLVGLASHRRQFIPMARSTLFRNRFFAWLIKSLNAIPVDRATSDMAAMRRALDALNRGNSLLIFPEGTRAVTAHVGPFKSGSMLLIKRARPTVVPVAIEGAGTAWPKGRPLPLATGRIAVQFGQPIPADELLAMGTPAAMEHLRSTVETMRQHLARYHDRCAGKPPTEPPPNPAR